MKPAQKTKELEITLKAGWAQTSPPLAFWSFPIARGAGSLESRPGKQKLGERSRNWAMTVESGPGRERGESEGRREERPELGDECGKLGLAEGARSEKDDLVKKGAGSLEYRPRKQELGERAMKAESGR